MKVLAVGAHPDDVELDCGGALAAHSAAGDQVTVLVLTNGSSGPGPVSERIHEQEEAAKALGAQLMWGDLPDGAVSNHERIALRLVEDALSLTGATRLYTHAPGDSHQDHRAAALLSFGAARNLREVLSFDSPSSRDFRANLYIDISDTLETRLEALTCHASQVVASRRVDLDFVRAQARYRGGLVHTCAAEGFAVERMVLQV